MLRFGERKIGKEKIYTTKKPTETWNTYVEKIVISKLIEIKTNSKYLTEVKFDKASCKTISIYQYLKWVDMLIQWMWAWAYN